MLTPKHLPVCWQASSVTSLQLQQYEQAGQLKQSPISGKLLALLFSGPEPSAVIVPYESRARQAQAAALVSTRNCRRQLQCDTSATLRLVQS